MNQRILVTGAAGFIGSHVCRRLLAAGYQVVGLDNFDPFYERTLKDAALEELTPFEQFRFFEDDVRNPSALDNHLRGVDAVVHLAARAGVRQSIEDPALYASINVGGTVTLLECCRRHQVRRIVFGSSSSVYGDDTPAPFREDAPCSHPVSPYAATKRSAELHCGVYSHVHRQRIASLRFFSVYGPGQRPDLAVHRFTDLIVQGEAVPQFGDGSTERDYTWVEDIVDGVLGALRWTDSPQPAFEIFNLGGCHPVRLSELINLLGGALGRDPIVRVLPAMAGDVRRTYADISKAARVLGYHPRVGIRDGIRRFVEWYHQARERSLV